MEYTQWNDSFIFTHKKHAYRAVIAFQLSNEWKKMEEKNDFATSLTVFRHWYYDRYL